MVQGTISPFLALFVLLINSFVKCGFAGSQCILSSRFSLPRLPLSPYLCLPQSSRTPYASI